MATADFTTTLAVNAAFFQEIKDVHRDLWNVLEQLRQLSHDPAPAREEFAAFVRLLPQLRDHVGLLFSLEEAYGYFEEPAIVSQMLSDRATSLRNQHGPLYQSVCLLAEHADETRRHNFSRHHASDVIREFRFFEVAFLDHEADENELIVDECELEFGDGD